MIEHALGAHGLALLRAEAEARMTSRVRVESVTVTADPLTGRDVESVSVVAESLPCRLKSAGVMPTRANVSSATVAELGQRLHVHWATVGLRVGMRATIIHSDTPSQVGVVLRLVSPTQGDQATAQRWEVESWPSMTPS